MSSDNDLKSEGTDITKSIKEEEEIKRVNLDRMEGLMKNMSRLSLAFGTTLILGMIIVCATTYNVRAPEVVVLGMVVGGFMVTSSLAINKSYGFDWKKLLPRKVPRLDGWLRMRSVDEVMAEMPSAYLVLSGLILVAASATMIVGDILVSNSAYRKLPRHIKGANFIFAGCTTFFVTTSCLGFALAMLTKRKHLKTIVACFFLSSLAGAITSATLNFTFKGPYHYSSMEFSRKLMRKDLQGSFIKGQDYPSAEISTLLIMKFASAEIVMSFSCFNVLLATTFFVDVKNGIKKMSSILLGILGIAMIALGLTLEIILDLLITSDIMTSGYSRSLQYFRPIVAISTLIAGIHAFHAFYSAGNMHRITLFALSFVVFTYSIFAIVEVLNFHREALEVETVALSPCPLNPNNTSHFCVYNTTEANQYNYDRSNIYARDKLPPPTLACIPREKLCDGKADLFVDKMDDYSSYRSYRELNFKLRFCGDTGLAHGTANPTPIDEVACYTTTTLPILVVAAITILAMSSVCAFTTLVVTSTSLPPAICFIFSVIKWFLGINIKDKEDEDIVVDDGDAETEALNV